MNDFLDALRNGGDSYSVERDEAGFTLTAAPGFEAAFDKLARTVADRVDPSFHAFLRGDDNGGYDRIQIIVVPEESAMGEDTNANLSPPPSQ